MENVFEKLSSSTLRSRIAEKIQEAILTGRLHEGERLVERKLAEQFDTSLTAVREALIQLETAGFVIKKPNSATYVTKLSLEAAEKIFTVRKVLEAFAVEEAARVASPRQVEQLEAAYGELLDTARSQSAQAFILKDLALHEMIWQLTANEYLEIALRRIVQPVFAFTAIRVLSCGPFDLLQDAQSHGPIIQAIKRNHPTQAKDAFLAAVEEWLNKTRDYLFAQFKKSGG